MEKQANVAADVKKMNPKKKIIIQDLFVILLYKKINGIIFLYSLG